MLIDAIQFCLLPASLAVNNSFCVVFSSVSLITFPLAPQASFFLSFALQLLSVVMSRGITHVPTIFFCLCLGVVICVFCSSATSSTSSLVLCSVPDIFSILL